MPMFGAIVLVCAITPAFAVTVPVLACFAMRVQAYYRSPSTLLYNLSDPSLNAGWLIRL